MIERHKQTLTTLAIENPGVSGKYKLAAGIIYKRRLVATGINSYKTHTMMMNKGYREEQIHLHAETDAIKNALRYLSVEQLSQSSLYVVRVKKEGRKWVHGLAKPCCGCMNWIAQYNIKEVEYTEDD
jgi:deoxycytidylate deaminase